MSKHTDGEVKKFYRDLELHAPPTCRALSFELRASRQYLLPSSIIMAARGIDRTNQAFA